MQKKVTAVARPLTRYAAACDSTREYKKDMKGGKVPVKSGTHVPTTDPYVHIHRYLADRRSTDYLLGSKSGGFTVQTTRRYLRTFKC